MTYNMTERPTNPLPAMLTATVARSLAASPCVVYFTKKDGTARRMVTAPTPEGVTARGTMVRVWDAEKGAYRTVNAATVSRIVALAARARVASPARLSAEQAAAWAADFDTGYRSHR